MRDKGQKKTTLFPSQIPLSSLTESLVYIGYAATQLGQIDKI
jgi:hypothetical protein